MSCSRRVLVRSVPFALAALCLTAVSARGQEIQPAPLASRLAPTPVNSGLVQNTGNVEAAVFSTIIQVPDAEWLRLKFDIVTLSGDEARGTGSYLRMTSLLDGAVQTLHASHVAQWRKTSAYFNGDAVEIEIVSQPGSGSSRLVISETTASAVAPAPRTICGSVDDRMLSNDPRAGRALPVGCTAWLINDASNCFITAGHCTGNLNVVEFNVPLSNGPGSLNHPPPEDQYSVDAASMQSNGGQGVGNDWGYFGCFPNSTTGLNAAQAQGSFFVLSQTPPAVAGQNIRITGYGTTSSPVPPTWYQVQKTHAGPYFSFSGSTVRYRTDTSGGNSGSPVVNEATGEAIGVHTHGGCTSTGGSNAGTGINHTGFQNALSNPVGVCVPRLLAFQFPNGRPTLVDPSGGTSFRVDVLPLGTTPQPGTGKLHYDAGQGFVTISMQQISPNAYDAVFPAILCRTQVRYFVSAENTLGVQVNNPLNAPTSLFDTIAGAGIETLVANAFETAPGWTVQNTNLLDGAWERGVPAAGGVRWDPPTDYDGSGQCFVTGNGVNADVDGGPTRLISPAYDLSGGAFPMMRYARWFGNNAGDMDSLDVELSDDNGSSWTLVERVRDLGWFVQTVNIADFVNLTSQVRVRFSVADNPNNSITEAALDFFSITDVGCGGQVVCTKGDVNQDGIVDSADIAGFTDTLIAGGPAGTVEFCSTDIDDDGMLELGDDLRLVVACLLGINCQ